MSAMKAIVSIENIASQFVLSFWTPVFVGIFLAIVFYALRPRNKALFDAAAKMPLRED
jgi:cytochrome c oxidase cbb3-type subunit 4